jgi:hypothetical protein
VTPIDDFVATKLAPFIGANINLVGRAIEDTVDASPFCWRWLEPSTVIAPEQRPDRINVHVDLIHTITKVTVG